MGILEALRLCRDTGARTRPACWRDARPHHWVEYHGGRYYERSRHSERLPIRLTHEAELLGEWEVIDDA